MSDTLSEKPEQTTEAKVLITITDDANDPAVGNIELFLENLDPSRLPDLLRFIADTQEAEMNAQADQ